jgi:hypothetical protein
MGTLATVYNRLFAGGFEQCEDSARTAHKDAHKDTTAPVRLRNFANEDIYFHIKRIDNTGVVRVADPQASGVCWKAIGSVGAVVVLLIGVLLPGGYGLLAGYQIQSMRKEGQRLANEQASLELQEAQLLSPARMEELARIQQFIDPAPQRVVYLDSPKELARTTELGGADRIEPLSATDRRAGPGRAGQGGSLAMNRK